MLGLEEQKIGAKSTKLGDKLISLMTGNATTRPQARDGTTRPLQRVQRGIEAERRELGTHLLGVDRVREDDVARRRGAQRPRVRAPAGPCRPRRSPACAGRCPRRARSRRRGRSRSGRRWPWNCRPTAPRSHRGCGTGPGTPTSAPGPPSPVHRTAPAVPPGRCPPPRERPARRQGRDGARSSRYWSSKSCHRFSTSKPRAQEQAAQGGGRKVAAVLVVHVPEGTLGEDAPGIGHLEKQQRAGTADRGAQFPKKSHPPGQCARACGDGR
jgi:hypothetical protein